MTNQHPITPPPELVQRWNNLPLSTEEIITIAWRHGADQELEACEEWIANETSDKGFIANLRAARRPKPPSLKKQALSEVAAAVAGGNITPERGATIRLALEQLND